MSGLREAGQQALEAIEHLTYNARKSGAEMGLAFVAADESSAALRAALAEQAECGADQEIEAAAIGWQETCSRCKHLLRSGDDGNVWHCAAVRVGKNPAYAVTARAESLRQTAPARGKCGSTARLFEAA